MLHWTIIAPSSPRAKCILARSSLLKPLMIKSALGRRWLWLSYTIAAKKVKR
jgi:hypothetical protein